MKSNRTFFLLLVFIFLFVPMISHSQGGGCGTSGPEHYLAVQRTTHPERLTLAFEHDLVISIECREILDIPATIDAGIKVAGAHLERLHDSMKSLPTPLMIHLSAADQGTLRISVRPDTLTPFEMVYHKSDSTYSAARFRYTLVYPVAFTHTLVISMNHPDRIQDLLSTTSIDSLVQQAQTHIASLETPRFVAKSCTYHVTAGTLDLEEAHIHRKADRTISIMISPGLSYLNGTVVPSIGFPVYFFRSRKQGAPIAFGFAFDMLLHMDTETPYKIRNNWYADGLLRIGERGTTFSAGYLIHREGELLPPNACRLSIGIPLTRSGAIQWHTSYHFSTMNRGQSLIEMGVRMWR